MNIINFYDYQLPPIPGGGNDSLIVDYNLLLPSHLLIKYYFYLKVFYILIIVGFYLCLIFTPYELDTAMPAKQSTLSNLNRLVKDYAGIIIMLGALHTGHIQYKTALAQEEATKYMEKSNILKAKVDKLEVTLDEANKKLSNANNVTDEVEVRLGKANTIANDLRVSMNELKKDTAEINRLKISLSNEENAFNKTRISGEIDALGIQINRRFQGNIDGLDKATNEIESTVEIIKEAMSSADNSNTSSSSSNSAVVDQTTTKNNNEGVINDSDIKKSSVIDFDLLREWMNDLSLIRQIAVSLLIGHSIILSVVVNILFIQFGEKFISKYNLEIRFPTLKRILDYRRKFQKFYMINGVFLIVITSISYIAFAISILIL